MTAKQILEMIETVDPDDTAKLDEIDARVHCYLASCKYAGMNTYYVFRLDASTQCEEHEIRIEDLTKYTRSRDALKAIRPEEYFITVRGQETLGFVAQVWTSKNKTEAGYAGGFMSEPPVKELPTEELAELHAIIQAIEHERSEK